MNMIARSDAGSRFYVDMEHGDVFEEGADGVFVLKRIDGRKERIAIDAIPDGRSFSSATSTASGST